MIVFSFSRESFKIILRVVIMFDSGEDPTILDVVRSMKRLGFSYDEIYDILTGAGIPSGEVELLLDRIEADFDDAKLKSRKSRLGEEVRKIFDRQLKETKIEINSEIRTLKEKIKSTNAEIERLEERITELQKTHKNTKQNISKNKQIQNQS